MVSYKVYLIIIFVTTLVSWVAFGIILTFISPLAGGVLGKVLFYLSVFTGTSGLFFFIGFYGLRLIFGPKKLAYQFNNSFRQGILLSLVLVGILVLQGLRVLYWWSGGLIILVIALVEFFSLREH